MTPITRRRALVAPAGVAALFAIRDVRAEASEVEVRMKSDALGAHVWFDPVGLLLRPGQTVRWVCEANYHTTTAYSPANDHRSLRIPRAAKPWNSPVLSPGEHFAVRLTVAGTYDYCCVPHEAAGMVGRLVVDEPGGPGSLPFDWFKATAEGRTWREVPKAAQAAFPPMAAIMRQHTVKGTPIAMCTGRMSA